MGFHLHPSTKTGDIRSHFESFQIPHVLYTINQDLKSRQNLVFYQKTPIPYGFSTSITLRGTKIYFPNSVSVFVFFPSYHSISLVFYFVLRIYVHFSSKVTI